MDQLQRDRRLEDEVVGVPHVAHAAAADPRDHPVAAGEDIAGRERFASGFAAASRDGGVLGSAGILLVERQQRLDLVPQRRVGAARLGDEDTTLVNRLIQRREKQFLRSVV